MCQITLSNNWLCVKNFQFLLFVSAINLLVSCALWPGVAEAAVGAEQWRYVRVLGGEGGVVPHDTPNQLLVWGYAGRLGQVLGK